MCREARDRKEALIGRVSISFVDKCVEHKFRGVRRNSLTIYRTSPTLPRRTLSCRGNAASMPTLAERYRSSEAHYQRVLQVPASCALEKTPSPASRRPALRRASLASSTSLAPSEKS